MRTGEDGGIGLRWEGKECDERGDYEIEEVKT